VPGRNKRDPAPIPQLLQFAAQRHLGRRTARAGLAHDPIQFLFAQLLPREIGVPIPRHQPGDGKLYRFGPICARHRLHCPLAVPS
jgi:hypothetical protein